MPNESFKQDAKKKESRGLVMSLLTSCPPISPMTTVGSMILLLALIYGSFLSIMGPPVLPGGPVFGLFVLFIVCYLGGQLMRLMKVPSLVGMMVFGFLLKNVPHINVAKDIPDEWAATIRNLALVMILLRAGLEVDADVLKRNKLTSLRLILIPFVVELFTATIVSHFLLDLPWDWGFLLGFMLTAISAAVVLPVMLKLQKKGIGVTKGIPTMVIAVAGLVDVLALTGFQVILGIIFATGSLGWTIARGPVEVVMGIVYGAILGLITWYIPNPEEKSKNLFRVLILIFAGVFVLFGSQAVDWGAAGALGCITMPFVATMKWKKQGFDQSNNPVSDALSFVWRLIEPFLFGLIGAEVKVDEMQISIIGLGLATLFITLAFRMMASMVSAFGNTFTLKEQIFLTFSGLPKATVQAALGPVALTLAMNQKSGKDFEDYGFRVLTMAVLSILVTAPLGATAMALLAPRLLEKDAPNDIIKEKPKMKPDDRSISIIDGTICTCEAKSKVEEFTRRRSSVSNGNVFNTVKL